MSYDIVFALELYSQRVEKLIKDTFEIITLNKVDFDTF
jgi:hypothetical protein